MINQYFPFNLLVDAFYFHLLQRFRELFLFYEKSIVIVFGSFWLMIASILNASSTTQTLLDQLKRAQSMDEAGPIVDKLWKEWTSAHKNSDEKALMSEGLVAMSEGNLDRAENIFTKLIELNPSFTEAWNKRATLRFMLWDFEGSLLDVEKVLTLEPRHFGALSGLGMIHLRLGDPERALKAYEDLVNIFQVMLMQFKRLSRLKTI